MNTQTDIYAYRGFEVGFLKQAENNVMINATEMAKAFGKRTVEYLRLDSTNELIKAIKKRNSLSITEVGKNHIADYQIVSTFKGGKHGGGNTWMYQTLALDFAQWLSVDFKLWCLEKIEHILNRKPELDKAVALELI